MNRRVACLLVAALGFAPACGDSSGPTAGTLKVRLQMPVANTGLDGAILLTVKGPAQLTSAQAGTDLQLFQAGFGADSTRFAIIGTLNTDTDVLLIGVQDVRRAGDYKARVDQVAASTGYALRPLLTEYSLQVRR